MDAPAPTTDSPSDDQLAADSNARAAGHIVLRRGAATESYMVRELADADKPEIIKAFLDKFASQVQRFFDVPAGSPVDAFRATAARTPVFELVAGA